MKHSEQVELKYKNETQQTSGPLFCLQPSYTVLDKRHMELSTVLNLLLLMLLLLLLLLLLLKMKYLLVTLLHFL